MLEKFDIVVQGNIYKFDCGGRGDFEGVVAQDGG